MKNIYLIGAILLIIILVVLGIYFINQTMQNKTQPAENNQANQQNSTTTKKDDFKGLKVEVLKEGSGAATKAGDTISVHYVGTFIGGKKFDSSRDRGMPFIFTLGAGQVIQGWDLGLVGMQVGESRKLTIPSNLAYGPNDYAGIPGGSTLIFEVELLNISQQ
jgi:FKBP-type peptidyl-prolyl cis-trans isomerase FkpA